jgi:hypothetical protein
MRAPRLGGSVRLQPLFPPVTQLGTANPEAFGSPLLRHRSVYAEFDTVSQLSSTLAALKSEHGELARRLTDVTTDPTQTCFTALKKCELDFAARLVRRDAELIDFGTFLNRYRSHARPTFVEVDASARRKTAKKDYDLINASLLVSNEQHGFFTRPDLERQIAELRILIDQQEEVLRLLTARLKLFNSFTNARAAQFTLGSLASGRPPTSIAAETPTVACELRTKLRVLQAELEGLVGERKRLAGKRIAARIAKRATRPKKWDWEKVASERMRKLLAGDSGEKRKLIADGAPASDEVDRQSAAAASDRRGRNREGNAADACQNERGNRGDDDQRDDSDAQCGQGDGGPGADRNLGDADRHTVKLDGNEGAGRNPDHAPGNECQSADSENARGGDRG